MTGNDELLKVKNQRGYLEYVRDVVQSHSPASKKLLDLAVRQFDNAIRDAKNGEKLLWTTLKCIPLIYSVGVKPLMFADIVRYGESELIPQAENFFRIPPETCSMIKAEYGTLYKYRNENIKKILVAPYLQCEPTLLAAGEMKKHGYDVYLSDVVERPRNMNEEREGFFKSNLRNEYLNILDWIGEGGYDPKALESELIRSNRIKDKVTYLEELESKHNTYLRTVAAMLVRCGVENYYAQPDCFESILDELTREMENLKEGEYHDESLSNVVWSGARGVDFSAFIALDRVGGHVSYWNIICNLDKRYDLSLEPLDALVIYDHEVSLSESISQMCDTDVRLIKQSKAEGLVLFQTQGCTYNSVSFELRRKELTDRNIPVLLLTGNTQTGDINGQTLIRLEAFMEILKKV